MLVLRITSPLFKRKASGINITVNQGLIIVTSNQNKNIAWSHVNIEIVLRPIGGEPAPNFENRRDLIFVSFIIFFALIFLLSYVVLVMFLVHEILNSSSQRILPVELK